MGADVVVVGGGISGMVAAHRLARAGAGVTLVERSRRLGGIVETTIDDGFVVEGGPDSFIAAKGSVVQLAGELGLEADVISMNPEAGGSHVWWEGELHPLPGGFLLMVPTRLRALLTSSLLSRRGRARALADLVLPRAGPQDDESLGSFVRRRLGAEVLERIAEPLVAGIHAADPETMSLRASFPRFLEMEDAHRSLILAARRAQAAQDPVRPDGRFSSFRMGMGQLVSALADASPGVNVRTGLAVTAVAAEGGRFEVVLDDGRRRVAAGVVLAVPAPVAARLVEAVSADAARSLSGIGQVSNTAVTLAYPTEHLPPLVGSGFVVPASQGLPARGVSYVSRKWAGRVPGPGDTLVRVFFGAGRDVPGPVDSARSVLAATLGVTVEPGRVWVRAHRHGLHRYTLGHLERVATAERSLEKWPGLVLAGAGFHGVGLNECVRSGSDAADAVLQALGREAVPS